MRESRFGGQAAGQLVIDSRPVGGAVVIAVAGEIDLATSPQLQEAVEETIARAGGLVVIDLCEVTFLGSTGLAVLAEADARARAQGKLFRVVAGENRVVTRPIQLTGLDRMLAMYDRVDSAVSAVREA